MQVADLFFGLGAVLDVALSYVFLFNKSHESNVVQSKWNTDQVDDVVEVEGEDALTETEKN